MKTATPVAPTPRVRSFQCPGAGTKPSYDLLSARDGVDLALSLLNRQKALAELLWCAALGEFQPEAEHLAEIGDLMAEQMAMVVELLRPLDMSTVDYLPEDRA